MKKIISIFMVLFVVIVISACGKDDDKEGNIDKPDGKYFAIQSVEDMKSAEDYRYWTVVTVKNKKITKVEWNAYHTQGGIQKCEGASKYDCSVAGIYGMNGNKGEWHEQANKVTKWIVDNQKYTGLTFDNKKTDAISSVSITTEELFLLVQEALVGDPVPKGNFGSDGYYYAEDGRTEGQEYKYVKANNDGQPIDAEGNPLAEGYTVDDLVYVEGEYTGLTFGAFIVVNGTLVHVDFNAAYTLFDFVMDENKAFVKEELSGSKLVICDETGKPVKEYKTKDGAKYNYGMRGKTFNKPEQEWFLQAQAAEEKLLEDQTLDITVTDGSGVIDGLSQVSMGHTVASFKKIIDDVKNQAN